MSFPALLSPGLVLLALAAFARDEGILRYWQALLCSPLLLLMLFGLILIGLGTLLGLS
jgi:hypothetical protein